MCVAKGIKLYACRSFLRGGQGLETGACAAVVCVCVVVPLVGGVSLCLLFYFQNRTNSFRVAAATLHRCMTSLHLHSLYIPTDRSTLPFYPRLGEASKGKITITFHFFGTKLTVKQEQRQSEYLIYLVCGVC